jgi:hypothetical protein
MPKAILGWWGEKKCRKSKNPANYDVTCASKIRDEAEGVVAAMATIQFI